VRVRTPCPPPHTHTYTHVAYSIHKTHTFQRITWLKVDFLRVLCFATDWAILWGLFEELSFRIKEEG